MSPIITRLLHGLKSQKRPGEFHAYPLMFELALHEPSQLGLFLRSVIDQFPAGGTFFNDAISFLPLEEFDDVVAHALRKLKEGSGNHAAEELISQASLQCPQALHTHLTELLDLGINKETYYRAYPWRGSGLAHFAELKKILKSRETSTDQKEFALEALFETRQPEAMKFALESRTEDDDPDLTLPGGKEMGKALAELKDLLSDSSPTRAGKQSPFSQNDPDLLRVGYEANNGQFRSLYFTQVRHLIFEPGYFPTEEALHLRKQHPSWNLKDDSLPPARFGGKGSMDCPVCGGRSHHLLTMDPVPTGLGISSVKRLKLESCLSCLGWEKSPLFYRHDSKGGIQWVGYEGARVKPQFPADPLLETQVKLTSTPERWIWQDWGLTNSRQNLHRLGGHPCWIQGPEYPRCPECDRTMQFLMQLDSYLPSGRGEFLWGSGGIAYGYWCDECRISAFHWQCT